MTPADTGRILDAQLARRWWKEAVVYQIYPRSFMDSNGDGVGDLPGITSKLDYLKALGIDVVWLSPHFDSPNADNGYDIRDYRKVMAEFGTMADFDAMLAGMKARGLRLIIDLVVNHTSDQHAWFAESRKSRDNPYRDYYIWRDGAGDGPPNNYPSIFGGSAWTLDAATGQYYLHYFTPQQPDLNWDNPKVRAEVHGLMRFWLDKGVSGFRMDVIAFISKPPSLPDLTDAQLEQPQYVYADGPRVHDYLAEMNRDVFAAYDVMTVGEAFGVTDEQVKLFTDEDRRELDMVFIFDVVNLRRGGPEGDWTLPRLKAIYSTLDRIVGDGGWNTAFFSNHDQPRAVSRFGDDDPAWRGASAKTLATVLITQRATPFIYQGEEIGMTNYPWSGIEDVDDVDAKNKWRDLVLTGRRSAEAVLDDIRRNGRDNARTPMQWTAEAGGGFSTGAPWLPVNPSADAVNVGVQEDDPASVLNHFRRLIALRKGAPALTYGAYRDIDPDHSAVFAYTRRLDGEAYLIAANFSRDSIDYAPPGGLALGDVVLSSQAAAERLPSGALRLRGWESVIVTLRD